MKSIRGEKEISITGFVLSERPDRTRCLAVTAGVKSFDLAFSPEMWEKLAEDARWFRENVGETK